MDTLKTCSLGQSSFVNHARQDHTVGEPAAHAKAKARIQGLLEARGFSCRAEYPLPVVISDRGERSYICDLYCERRVGSGIEKINPEINGRSHNSKGRYTKDKIRKQLLLTLLGIRMVDFQPEDINGHWQKNRVTGEKVWSQSSDAEILEELGL